MGEVGGGGWWVDWREGEGGGGGMGRVGWWVDRRGRSVGWSAGVWC